MFRNSINPVAVIFIIFMAGAVINATSQETVDYNARLVEVLEGYHELLSVVPEGDMEDAPKMAWYITSLAIQDESLRFSVDPVSQGLLTGARFIALPNEKVAHIIVSQSLLDIWPKYPATVYLILTGAVQESAVFFQNPTAWGKAQRVTMEQLLIKFESYRAQATLLQNRILPQSYALSPYDTYLLNSYEKDELVGVMLYLERFSLPIIQLLYQARIDFEENNNEDMLRAFILDLGETLLTAREEILSEEDVAEQYASAIAIHSWLELTPEIVSRIHNKDRIESPLLFDQVLMRESSYNELRSKMELVRIQEMSLMQNIAEETIRRFGAPRN